MVRLNHLSSCIYNRGLIVENALKKSEGKQIVEFVQIFFPWRIIDGNKNTSVDSLLAFIEELGFSRFLALQSSLFCLIFEV